MLLTLILCVVLGYVGLVFPVAVVVGRALREQRDPYAGESAVVAYPRAPRPEVTVSG